MQLTTCISPHVTPDPKFHCCFSVIPFVISSKCAPFLIELPNTEIIYTWVQMDTCSYIQNNQLYNCLRSAYVLATVCKIRFIACMGGTILCQEPINQRSIYLVITLPTHKKLSVWLYTLPLASLYTIISIVFVVYYVEQSVHIIVIVSVLYNDICTCLVTVIHELV